MASHDSFAAFRIPEFRWLLLSSMSGASANAMLSLVVAYQVYLVTKNPLALGIMGLVEAIPAIAFALLGGHVADRFERRRILLWTKSASLAVALAYAVWVGAFGSLNLTIVLLMLLLLGVASGFSSPAMVALEAVVVPKAVLLNATSWLSSAWQAVSILGPVLGGLLYAAVGALNALLGCAALFGLSLWAISRLSPKPAPPFDPNESAWQSIKEGWRFVTTHQVFWGSMTLDLLAVLFGGAVALLPIFAQEFFDVGPQGMGLMAAAPGVGALLVMLWSARFPPVRHAGRDLFLSVGGFGLCMVGFGLSQNFWLSLVFLALSGACDGLNMVIRKTIVRLLSPDHMRGRIGSIGSVFVGASNEIGAFESGVAASLFGVRRSVWWGGLLTVILVLLVARWTPQLRRLDLSEALRSRRQG